MTDVESTSAPEVVAAAPEPEVVQEPEPRITNDSEGKKKQKDAVKKLSDYSRETMSRKAEPAREDPQQPEKAPVKSEPIPQQESSLSIGNIIAAAGVAVAVVCLYLSYGSSKPKIPDDSEVVVAKAPKNLVKKASEPKFRKL